MDSTKRTATRFCEHCGKTLALTTWYRHRDNPDTRPYPRTDDRQPRCSIADCDKPARVRGWCKGHYRRYLYSGDPAGKYGPRGGGAISHGYHVITENGKTTFVHRMVAEQTLGRPLRDDEVVHHIDGNPLNNHPENLAVMSQSEHMRIHRPLRETCGKGHPFTPENTRWKTYANGKKSRECITCIRTSANARYHRKKRH